MNRSIGKIFREAVCLFFQDLWNIRVAILIFAVYFLVGSRVLYSLCPMVVVTGLPCPGCGLTRAAFRILHGDFVGAWKMHPFIYGVIVLAVWFCVRRYILKKEVKSLGKWVIILCLGMMVYYVYRMVRYFPGEAPMSYYGGNVMRRVFGIVKSVWAR